VRKYFTRQGFTLIELMLVSAIILALVGVSMPVFKKTYEDLIFTSYVKDMSYAINFCRERAVFERRQYRLLIDNEKNAYNILTKDEDDAGFIQAHNARGSVFKVPNGVQVKSDRQTIDFLPDGTMDSATIYITDKEDRIQGIRLDGNSGSVSIHDDIK
jgi:prepilin-type N-terminal cleavage/methylation domain-containing protein